MCQVSIIMPAFNAESYILDSIQSVQNQSFHDWELLIVDDSSSDNTIGVASQVASTDSRIRVFSSACNGGAAVARNKAIEIAQGRFVAFLDCDDQWKPQKLEKQVAFMAINNVALSYTNYDIADDGGFIKTRSCPTTVSYSDLLKTNYIGCLTAMYDTQAIGKVLMPLIRKRQDFALWLKILKLVPKAYGLNESLAIYRLRSGSISSNKLDAARYTWKLYREVEKLHFLKSIYYFSYYAILGFLSRMK